MAHKKGVGSTDNGRDSIGRRLGVKLFGGQQAIAGNIIIRQRGTKFHPGDNVNMGKDHTIHALVDGTVVFRKKRNNKTYVSILPAEGVITIKPRKAKKVKSAAPKSDAPAPAAKAPKAKKAAAPKKTAAPKKEAPKAAAPKAEAPKAETKVTETTSTPHVTPNVGGSTSEMPKGMKLNDLTAVEGIGPKIGEVLVAAGIDTWEKLGNTMASKIKEVLDAADGNFAAHDPATWPTQAKMAAEGKWSLLKAWQDKLDGGKLD